jgi:hypothetical protein
MDVGVAAVANAIKSAPSKMHTNLYAPAAEVHFPQ